MLLKNNCVEGMPPMSSSEDETGVKLIIIIIIIIINKIQCFVYHELEWPNLTDKKQKLNCHIPFHFKYSIWI